MKKIFTADWVLPVCSDPIQNGAVVFSDDKVVALGPASKLKGQYEGVVRELRGSVILPGLVNAHVHLDFSMLRDKIPPHLGFGKWVQQAMGKRKEYSPEEISSAAQTAIAEMISTGTVAIGDVTNNDLSYQLLKESLLDAVIFIEETGFPFHYADPTLEKMLALREKLVENDRIKVRLSPHAPYSTSPVLMNRIREYNKEKGFNSTVHLAESPEEVDFVMRGTGFFRDFLDLLGRWEKDWECPGVSPVRYLAQTGFLDETILAVHLVQVDEEDIELLVERNVNICTCPRSNEMIGAGVAPVEKFLGKDLSVSIATDSLASNCDLNLFNEVRFLKEIHPGISNTEVLKMVTVNPAQALGIDDRFGSIEAGRPAKLIAVKNAGNSEDPFALFDRPIVAADIQVLS